MNWIDFVILLFVVAGVARGFSKGLIFELSGLLGIIIAIYVSRFHSEPFADFVGDYFNVSKEYCPALGMVTAFIASLFLVKALSMLAVKLIKAVSLGWLNNLLGALISALKYTIAISIVINVLSPINQKVKILDSRHSEGSVLCEPVMKVAPAILPLLKLNELTKIEEK